MSPATRSKLHRTDYPGIYRRGTRYVVIWRHAGRQLKRTYSALPEARQAQAQHKADAARRAERRESRDPFACYARSWIAEYRGRTHHGIYESTRLSYERSLELYAIPAFGSIPLADVRPREIRALVSNLEKCGLRISSVRRALAPVKALFASAVEDGDLARNPASSVRVGPLRRELEQPKRRDALTVGELRALLDAVEPEWRLLIEFLAHTGLRISEALGLQWLHVRLGDSPSVSVRQQVTDGIVKPPKSRNGLRTVPLSPGVATALTHLRAQSRSPTEPVFCSVSGGYLDDANLRNRVLRPAAERAGLEPFGFHVLRHTCASLLFAAGKDIKQIQEWLGHYDPRVTLSIYVHLLDRGLGEAAFFDTITQPDTPTCDND